MTLPDPIVIDVPVDLAFLDDARDHLADIADDWGLANVQDVQIVATELLANAIRHAATPSSLSVRQTAQHVRLAVTDTGAGHPAIRDPYDNHTAGMGLRLVELLSTEWGCEDNGNGGKTVWATLPL